MLKWKKVWQYDLSLLCSRCKDCFSQNFPKGEIVRVLDMYCLQFVKTLVLARCQTRCLNMLARHHSVPCSTYLEIRFKREDFHILSRDLFHMKSWPRKRGSRSRERRFILSLVLKDIVATFKETSDLFQNICAEISWFSWSLAGFVHQAHSASMLYKQRQKT